MENENKLLTREQNLPLKTRYSNLDLLRGFCAVFVVFEHFCETTAHNAFGFTLDSSMTAHVLLRLIYGIARTAVPVFFLISGYLSINSSNQKLGKAINLFIMTGTYSGIAYFASSIFKALNGEFDFSVIHLLLVLFPKNYYLYLFCALYAFSPFLNMSLKKMKQKNYLRLIIILFSLFSIWSTVINTVNEIISDNQEVTGWYFTSRTGTSMGFNIANFTMLYIIGGYIRLYYKAKPKRDILFSTLTVLCSTVITTTGKIFFPPFKAFLYYDSVFVIISAISLMIIFLNVKVKPNRVIEFMGVHTFGTYLLHSFVTVCVEKVISVKTVVSSGFGGALLGIAIFVIGVYILSLIMTTVLESIVSPINKMWKKTKLFNYKFQAVDPEV